jgi:hypothetical protein
LGHLSPILSMRPDPFVSAQIQIELLELPVIHVGSLRFAGAFRDGRQEPRPVRPKQAALLGALTDDERDLAKPGFPHAS